MAILKSVSKKPSGKNAKPKVKATLKQQPIKRGGTVSKKLLGATVSSPTTGTASPQIVIKAARQMDKNIKT